MKKNKLCKYFATVAALLFSFGVVMAQNVTVTGTVTSSDDGLPIPGASVVQKGTTLGVNTDANGLYQISVPKGATLQYSFMGMATQEIVVGDQTRINVVLVSSIISMDEVVVTALGISREKKSLGYAITEVSGSEIARAKEINVVNSLSGRVAGVVVTTGSFGPGSSSRIVIRGNHSITQNNQPLFVVDGIPFDNSGFGSSSGEDAGEYSKSDYGSGAADINSDDIESMSILKGPNAAALYGSRAANGVILITTKKGSLNKGLGVSYSGNFTFESPLILPKFQNEYGQGTGGNVTSNLTDLLGYSSWGAKMDGTAQLYWNGETRPYSPMPDNVKDFFRIGSTLVNTIALDGGNAQSSFRFSYTNTTANSILPGSDLKRHNFNFRATTQLTNKFSVDAKVTYFVQDSHNRPMMGTEGVIANLYAMPRNTFLEDLETYQAADYSVISYNSGAGNPYWVMKHDVNDDSKSRIQGYVKANYDFSKSFSAFFRVGTDATSQKIETINQYGHWYYPQGRLDHSMQRLSETNVDALLMYKKDLSSKFNLSINAGANHMYHTSEGMSIYAQNFKIPTKPTLESASINLPSYYPLQEKIVNSVYGFATLSYNNFLYLETSMRNDWSSTLPKGNWSYFYPSVSLSAVLNEILNIPVMDFGKVRINWAKVGNDTDPYQLMNAFLISAAGDSYLSHTILTRPSVKYDENLKPEQTSSLEFGGEFRFLKNRIYTDMSYYSIKSVDLIMNINIPPSTGYSLLHTNVGEMTNKGFEILLGGIPVQKPDFTWDVSLNFSKNTNKLVSLIEGTNSLDLSTTNSGSILVKATAGGGYGDIYATTYQRDAQGRIVVNDAGLFIAGDYKKVGNYQPDWVGGLSNTFTYKNLSLRLLIDARIGGELYSGTDAGLDAGGVSDRSLKYRETGVVINGVHDDGTVNTTSVSAEQYWQSYSNIAENYIFDQTNIRMREITLTYDLPGKLVNNSFLKGVSLGITGRNLFFLYRALDNFDPESSFSVGNYAQGVLFYNMPTTRSIGFNVSLKF
jgi:TonB-linked SusC/RagA family outer membrane protein